MAVKNLNVKWYILLSIALIVVGVALWLYSDYSLNMPVSASCTSGSGITSYASAATYNYSNAPSGSLSCPTPSYLLTYIAIALIILGTALWAYFDHKGKLVLLSIALIAVGVLVWALGDFYWASGTLVEGSWYYTVGAGVALIAVGTALWAYLDRKVKLL